ncbi:MAG: hemolysin family protein [Thermoanaerobaculales bacterium]|nr:hemolysin family protein [Thermoanaerobaculales bacterium]
MGADLLWVALCLIGSAFFSASETALSSLPVTRLEALRQASGRLTRAGLDRWATAPQELLITILVGNNLVNVLASALATRIAYRLTDQGGLAVVVGLMTLVILVFGEITPKTLAQRHSVFISSRVAPVLFLLDVVLRPVNRVLGLLTRLLSRGRQPELPVTEADLLFMLRLAHRHAELPRDARLMMESVLRFQRAVAREVMVPRTMVVTVSVDWDLDRLKLFIASTPHSRFPVVEEGPDDIVGVVHAKHLMHLAPGLPWRDVVVPPLFVPEGRRLPDLLQDFRRAGQHLAVVLDEYGGFSGIVTLEDVLELVVGEIEDEFDRDLDTTVIRDGDGWIVPGYLSLRRLEGLVERAIEKPEDVESVGGLVADLHTGDVTPGDAVVWDRLELRVEAVEDGRATRVRVRRLPRFVTPAGSARGPAA